MPRPRTIGDDAVLDATTELIGRVGPARLTLAHVADAVGLSPATLVQRFGSKRGLLLAVARRPVDLAAMFDAARAAEPARLDALVAAIVALTRSVRTPDALANSIAFLQLDLADAEFHAEALGFFAALRGHVEALLREAARRGRAGPRRPRGPRGDPDHHVQRRVDHVGGAPRGPAGGLDAAPARCGARALRRYGVAGTSTRSIVWITPLVARMFKP